MGVVQATSWVVEILEVVEETLAEEETLVEEVNYWDVSGVRFLLCSCLFSWARAEYLSQWPHLFCVPGGYGGGGGGGGSRGSFGGGDGYNGFGDGEYIAASPHLSSPHVRLL